MNKITVRDSETSGRGLFSLQSFEVGELIEVCPVIIVPVKQVPLIDKTILFNYYFGWENGEAAIACGNGSFANHSSEPNARYEKNYADNTVEFYALSQINSDTEITVDYTFGGQHPLWFQPND